VQGAGLRLLEVLVIAVLRLLARLGPAEGVLWGPILGALAWIPKLGAVGNQGENAPTRATPPAPLSCRSSGSDVSLIRNSIQGQNPCATIDAPSTLSARRATRS
jgi:hypothetical protein